MCACKKSAPYDPIWPRLAPLALLARFGPIRHFLAIFAPFDPIWPRLTLFGTIWHHLVLFDPAWPHLALLGHSSILISRYFKVPIRQGATEIALDCWWRLVAS